MPKAVMGQNGLKPQDFAIFSGRGGPASQKIKCKKNGGFGGEAFWAAVFFPSKKAPSTGKLCFSVFRPEFLPSAKDCPRPKWTKPAAFRDFLPVGVQSAKT